ncbi:hypothetical protein [Brevibacillus migulae]|uniref:hypothetical protein n=1 Tax=Brevibacillus migulae TaxID=1644114 RepID=UPI00142FE9C7|nr:hypothetical protein [Brevibacillus migulae]
MIFNFIFFHIKIERNVASRAEQIAEYQREQYLNQAAEAFKVSAAQYPEFVSRI